MKLLIVYGTTEGQTEKIAEFLRDEAARGGNEVTLVNAHRKPPAPDDFDKVILAASVHMLDYQSSVKHYARKHHKTLNEKSTAFLSVSLTAADTDDKEGWEDLDKMVAKFKEKTGWEPTVVKQVAGALKYVQYNWFKRYIMRKISENHGGETDTSKDHEYTNWEDLKKFLEEFSVLEHQVG